MRHDAIDAFEDVAKTMEEVIKTQSGWLKENAKLKEKTLTSQKRTLSQLIMKKVIEQYFVLNSKKISKLRFS